MPRLDVSFRLPPSVNHYWTHTRQGRVYITGKGKEYRQEVAQAMLGKNWQTLTSPCHVSAKFFVPDRRKRDLDNLFKALLDALTHAGVWKDDSLVHSMYVEWGDRLIKPFGLTDLKIVPLQKREKLAAPWVVVA